MKMNFKYVSMMACAALMAAFTSCSNDEADANGSLPNGEMATVRFTLTQTGSATTRAVDATPTDKEKVVKKATLYVFDSSQVLEKIVPFPDGTITSEVVTVTAGGHYFLAAVNAPDATGITEGTSTLVDVQKTIVGVTVAGITGDDKGFFMTNTDAAKSQNLIANELNNINIKVGRAMAKVAVTCTSSEEATLTGDNGKLTNVKYVTANNPKKMYYFPVIEEGVFKAPYYANELVNTSDYEPELEYDKTYGAITALSVAPGTDSYLIENANKVVKRGNVSYLLISGKYVPAALRNNNDTDVASLPDDGTFYRLYNVDNDEYYDVYIVADSKDVIDPKDFTYDAWTEGTHDDAKGETVNVIEYKEGVCYYAFTLENKNNVAPTSKYTAKRNVYYDVVLNKVINAGASVPNINGNNDDNPDDSEVIPGTGGGNGGGNNNNDTDKGGKEEPVEGVCEIEGTISIEEWDVVNQGGNLGDVTI